MKEKKHSAKDLLYYLSQEAEKAIDMNDSGKKETVLLKLKLVRKDEMSKGIDLSGARLLYRHQLYCEQCEEEISNESYYLNYKDLDMCFYCFDYDKEKEENEKAEGRD